MSGIEPVGSRAWIKRLKSRGFALILALPLLFGLYLFEKFQDFRFKAAEEEARHVLVECAHSMAEESAPERALYSAFQALFPREFELLHTRLPLEFAQFQTTGNLRSGSGAFHANSMAFTARKTLDALSPYLKSTEQGVRLFIFDAEGKPGFIHSPPELIAPNSELWRGGSHMVFSNLTRSEMPVVDVASKAWDVLLRRFSNRVLFSELMESSQFDLVIPTEYSSATYFLIQGSSESPGILLEIDQENLNREAILQRSLDHWLPGVEMAAAIGDDGITRRMNSRGGFSPDQSFPIPARPSSIEFFPEGFFLKYPLDDGLKLVLGISPPALFSVSPTAKLLLEIFLLLSFLIFVRRLGESLTEESGEAQISLSRQLAGLFFIAALVPLLTLVFFGFHQALESPRAAEMVWVDRMHRKLLGMDRRFHQAQERYQEKLQRAALRLGSFVGRGISFESIFRSTDCFDFFFMDRFGRGYFTTRTRGGSEAASERFILSFLKGYLKFYQRALGQENPSGKPDIPDVVEVYLEEALRMNSPVRDFYFNQGRIGLLKVFTGEILTSYSQAVIGNDGVLQGVILCSIRISQVLRNVVFRMITTKAPNQLFDFFAINRVLSEDRSYGSTISKAVPPLMQKSVERQIELQTKFVENGKTYLFLSTTPSFMQHVTLGATVDLAHIVKRIRAHQRELAVLTILGAFIALAVGFLIRRHLLIPLQVLRNGVEQISQGHLSTRLPVESRDELGRLLDTFNQMAEGLQQKERMKRFVSREVWTTAHHEQAGQSTSMKRVDGAILFCDIRSFTTMSEAMPAPDVVALLNEYFSSMDTVIRRFGGEIDKLIGDAILAIFRPEPGKPDPAVRAVMAGLAMRATLSHFNRRREKQGKSPIEIGTGIHFGPLIEGRVGSARGRLDLTVVGPTLNQAMRLEGASKQGKATRIIVSAETATHLKGEFPLIPLEGDDSGLHEVLKPWSTISPESSPAGEKT